MIKFIGTTFPDNWFLGPFEKQTIQKILQQIEEKFPNENNIVINTTWFFINDNSLEWKETQNISTQCQKGNLFLLSFVDPAPDPRTLDQIYSLFPNFNLFKIGNFSGKYNLSFLSTIWSHRFKKYYENELKLQQIKYKFISYSRKPHQHRVDFYEKLFKHDLLKFGIATLGTKPKHFFNSNPENFSYSLQENIEDYKEHGHWYNEGDQNENYSIPHDIFSLGKLEIWKNHFLNIVNESLGNDYNLNKQEIMITEKTFKPLIGLRPFLLNGDLEIYNWLRSKGFKTFTHYFPIKNIEMPYENRYEDVLDPNTKLQNKIIEVLLWLKDQTDKDIIQLYNEMLPDLIHNRNRFYEFAEEEKLRINNIFNNSDR